MRNVFKFDTPLFLSVVFLLILGLVMITSIGVPKSIALSAPGVLYPNCSDANVDCYLLFKNHLIRLGIGLLAFYIAYRLPMKFWRKIATPFFAIVVVLLLAVLIFGSTFGTIAQNWITIFSTSLQPSEFAKLAIILYLAYWFSKKQAYIEDFKQGLIPFCIICAMIVFPIILENDFGGTLTISIIAVAMYFMAGAKLQHLGILFLVAFIGALLVILAVPHVRQRFQSFNSVSSECVEDYCWQSQQASIAVGSGGVFGKGLTQGVQKSYWLPQASDDFIFAASAEELGFFRIVFVILAYFVIALRGYDIASKSQGSFETLLAIGLTIWITVQAFVNIAVNTGLMPVTGITLPFVSYGGSSLIACLVAVGILLNLSQNTSYHENSINRWGNRRTHYPQRGHYRRA